MEVYSQPLSRVVFGQNKLYSMTASQRAMYFKYATIIKTFLIGTTADVLRMRLNQVADASLMSLKSFLNYHRVNIILALRNSQSSLILVFPPSDISPDLSTWNTGLLCLVLRACNCLNIREQDDVIYLSKVYKRYFNTRQDPGCGTMTRRGYIAKREWFKTCAAVQRLVEVVDDPELMKEVRAFICKVEIEGRSLRARKETQLRLESFISELISDDALTKNQDKNLTDEAKQMVKGEPKRRKTLKLKQKLPQRPQSAGAQLDMARERAHQRGTMYSKHLQRWSRPPSATKSEMSQSSRRSLGTHSLRRDLNSRKKSFIKVKIINDNVTEAKPPAVRKRELQSENKSSVEKKRLTVRKRPSSAVESIASRASLPIGILRRSSVSLERNDLNKRDRSVVSRSSVSLSKVGDKRSRPGSAKVKRQVKTVSNEAINKNENKKEFANKQTHEKGNKLENNSTNDHKKEHDNDREHEQKKEREKDSTEKYSYSPKSQRDSQIKRENSMILKGIKPMTGRRQKSGISKKNSKENVNRKTKEDARDAIICVPTAGPELTDMNDAVGKGNKQKDDKDKKDEEKAKETDATQGNKAKEKTTSCLDKFSTKEEPKTDEEKRDEKRKVFDDNMKKIANEVLVHQKIHEAVKNPFLQNKEFVDEFFAFLNENHVTKKFLRAQSVEPRESWNLPGGKHANLSFFVAFVFRHVQNKDVKIVSYVVEKMLLRMRCKHALEQRNSTNNVKSNESEIGVSNFSSEHENRRRAYKEVSSSIDYEQLRNKSRSRSQSRDRRSESSKRSRSLSKKDNLSAGGDEKSSRVYRSTCISDNLCWKCTQKDLALTACVNWSNRCLCDLLVSEGVLYKEEHLSSAVKANDLISLVKIVDFLKNRGDWNSSSAEVKDALFLARKLRMWKMVEFLTEEAVQDDRIENKSRCTPCFIA